jgi:hypothetical protein
MKPAPLLLLSLTLSACAPRPPDASRNGSLSADEEEQSDTVRVPTVDSAVHTSAAETADSARGTVVVTGMGPSTYTTLSSGEGPPIVLAGELEAELRQLAGAQVAVFGELTAGQRASLRVERYEVLSIDGERPVVGTVLPDGRGIETGRDTLTVRGYSESRPAGAKIWIVGRREGAHIRLLSWGVIRRP